MRVFLVPPGGLYLKKKKNSSNQIPRCPSVHRLHEYTYCPRFVFGLSASPGRTQSGETPRVNLDVLVRHVC
jgi:hypothetical protein